jgi:hypothetical protein
MDNNWGRIFGAGLVATLLIAGFVVFLKRGDRLEPSGTVLKERTIALNESTSLMVLDVRIVNDSDVVMNANHIKMRIETKDGGLEGHTLGRSDLDATFGYFPLLGEKYNAVLTLDQQLPPRSKVDRMIAATFEAPLNIVDARQKVTVRIEDGTGAAAEFSGK